MKERIKILMLKVLLFLGLALSIIKANGWIVVPTFCIVFCWIVSVIGWLIYAYAAGVTSEAIKKVKQQEAALKREREG